jgi:hypothetical protein
MKRLVLLGAGHYRFDQCRVLVEPTVTAAGGRLVLDRAVELRAAEQEVVLASGERLPSQHVAP